MTNRTPPPSGQEPEKTSPRPSTRPDDPRDPEFARWRASQRKSETAALTQALSASQPVQALARQPNGGPSPGGPPTPGGPRKPVPPLASFFAYINSRPDVDWNTCGQAAMASMLDFYGRDIGLPRGPNGHWDSGAAIDRMKQLGFGPDVTFGWGTTPDCIRRAMESFGLTAHPGHSGLFFSDWQFQWSNLLTSLVMARPVPVLVDLGALGGPPFTAHWPIVWRADPVGSSWQLRLANWSPDWAKQPIAAEQFLSAWAAPQLPLGFNHAAVYISPY